jgi:putative transposase
MVNYRRNKIPGGYYFFTVTLRDRQSKILVDHIDLLREAMRKVKAKYFFETHAIVILPEHIHAIWKLPT